MWALACVVGEMLSGKPPWAGRRAIEVQMEVAVKRQARPDEGGGGTPHDHSRRSRAMRARAGRDADGPAALAQAPPIPEGLPHQVCRRQNPYLPL
jgi:hypothetical protein